MRNLSTYNDLKWIYQNICGTLCRFFEVLQSKFCKVWRVFSNSSDRQTNVARLAHNSMKRICPLKAKTVPFVVSVQLNSIRLGLKCDFLIIQTDLKRIYPIHM